MAVHRRGSEETRERIVVGSGRGFRRHGYGGVGVDALAHEAGVTSGAFYGHFRSKAEVFREALTAGLDQLRAGIERVQQEAGAGWRDRFIDFYLTERRTCDPGDSCALQSLSVDAARAGEDARAAYEAQWVRVRDAAAEGFSSLPEPERRAQATALLALLAGGVSIARAVRRPEVSDAIADAVRQAASRLGDSPIDAQPGERPGTEGRSGARPGARSSKPPFSAERVAERVRLAEDLWNSRDPRRAALVSAPDGVWRERAEFLRGRAEIERFLERKWTRELDFRLIQEPWSYGDDRLSARLVYEWHDDSGHWFRSHGNEQWEMDDAGLLRRREASTNDVPIRESERLLRWPLGPRPVDHPGLTSLGL